MNIFYAQYVSSFMIKYLSSGILLHIAYRVYSNISGELDDFIFTETAFGTAGC